MGVFAKKNVNQEIKRKFSKPNGRIESLPDNKSLKELCTPGQSVYEKTDVKDKDLKALDKAIGKEFDD